jgi:hypothetical protein
MRLFRRFFRKLLSRTPGQAGQGSAPLSMLLLFQRGGSPSIVWFEGVRPVRAVRVEAGTGERDAALPCPDPLDSLSALSEPSNDQRPRLMGQWNRVLGGRGAGLNVNLGPVRCRTLKAVSPSPCPATSGTSTPRAGPSNGSIPLPASTLRSLRADPRSRFTPWTGDDPWPALFPRSRGWCGSSDVTGNEEGVGWPDLRG